MAWNQVDRVLKPFRHLGEHGRGFYTECKQYQDEVAQILCRLFTHPGQVVTDWSALANEVTCWSVPSRPWQHYKRTYAPQIDIAVGPFATQCRYADQYDNMMYESRDLLEAMLAGHRENVRTHGGSFSARPDFDSLMTRNRYARCFLAVEIENKNHDPKYVLGSVVNACALGRVGVVVAWSPHRLRQLLRLEQYLGFLAECEKNILDPSNLIVLDKEQFREIVGIDGALA